ncbi:MAG: hypothetical protein Q9222_003293 [Ikaeria aurantiellina]
MEKPEYRYEHGRRYHAYDEDAYYMPNDDPELARLGNALHLAPINNPTSSILDVGTGSGIWALAYAAKHPNSHVLGIDLSPVKPRTSVIPSNCTFATHNAETDWGFLGPHQQFDLIHSRFLVQGFHDWQAYFQKCYDYLKPGGWVEVHEIQYPGHADNPAVENDAPFLRWGTVINEALAKGGIDGGAATKFPEYLKDVGFEIILERKVPWPLGPWPDDEKGKKIGAMQAVNFNDALEGLTTRAFTKNLGWTQEEVENFVAEVRDDLKDQGKKYSFTV